MLFAFLLFLNVSFCSGQDLEEIKLANDYLSRGEKLKAYELYRKLSQSEQNFSQIYPNYITLLLDRKDYSAAAGFIRQVLKRSKELQYRLDLIYVYDQMADKSKSSGLLNELISEFKSSPQRVKNISDYFAMKGNLEYAKEALLQSRAFFGNSFIYSLELASVYRLSGDKAAMVEEYLRYVVQNSSNMPYVKKVLQTYLSQEDEMSMLYDRLIIKVQEDPGSEVYTDLLIWLSIQQKDFNTAFIQARAYDLRFETDGERTLEVAEVAAENGEYRVARKIYEYLKRTYKTPQVLLNSEMGLLKTREMEIRNLVSAQEDSARSLIQLQDEFAQKHPGHPFTYEIRRSQAMLIARTLHNTTEAMTRLRALSTEPNTPYQIRNQAKIDLGDLHLANREPWEATLLYSQVEKAAKESSLGYEAKLRNARLSYYRGDFRLAQEHLDILKEATEREISNDAIDLSMRIKENLLVDSTGTALHLYAMAELYGIEGDQKKQREMMQFLLEGSVAPGEYLLFKVDSQKTFLNTAILDDVYWLEARLAFESGDFATSSKYCEKIINSYPDDILADDAAFLLADMYNRQGDSTKAMQAYLEFLKNYPGSNYAAEARKRYRQLRGDFTDPNEVK